MPKVKLTEFSGYPIMAKKVNEKLFKCTTASIKRTNIFFILYIHNFNKPGTDETNRNYTASSPFLFILLSLLILKLFLNVIYGFRL